MAGGEAYKRTVNAAKTQQRRLDQARREAQARLGCEACGASKVEIRTEQERLRTDFYRREALRRAA